MALLLNNCDSISGWSIAGISAPNFTADTSDKHEGTASLQSILNGQADPYIYYPFAGPYKDVSSYNSVLFWFKSTSADPSAVGYLSLWSAMWSEGSWYQFSAYAPTWTLITIDLSDISSDTGPGVTLSNVCAMRVDYPASVSTTDHVDYIYADTVAPSYEGSESLVLSEEVTVTGLYELESGDTFVLADEVETALRCLVDEDEALVLSEETVVALEETQDLDSDFRTIAQSLSDANNKVGFCARVLSNFTQHIRFLGRTISDMTSDMRTKKRQLYNLTNDVRTALSWQRAANGQPISLGKSYMKVYINSVEQTDADIDSVIINKTYNTSSSAQFRLGRAYDVNIPTLEHSVSIEYNDRVLFAG